MYFILGASEDGLSFDTIQKHELLENLNNGEYGDNVEFLTEEDIKTFDFDFDYEINKILIIKGEVIIPKPKLTIKEYDI